MTLRGKMSEVSKVVSLIEGLKLLILSGGMLLGRLNLTPRLDSLNGDGGALDLVDDSR